MKKIFFKAAAVAGFTLLGMSSAVAATAFKSNVDVIGGIDGQCTLLSENVKLGASANVHGAWACDETKNLVQVAACHEGGSRQQGAACVDLDPEQDEDQLPPACKQVGGFSTIPDYKAFFTSSQGGVM